MSDKIKSILIASNPWWKSGRIEVDFKPRTILSAMDKYHKLRQIVALTGLRRSGKTTLLKKIMQDFLVVKNAEDLLFFSFDDFQDNDISDILEEYCILFHKGIREQVFFFDEIQKVKGWQEKVKRIYDQYPKTKIYLSGSESLLMISGGKESLAGRMFTFTVEPLSFPEFLAFKGITIGNPDLYKRELMRELVAFVETGGFPELVSIKDKEILVKYLRELILEKILFRDIPRLFPIENPAHLEAVMNIIVNNPGFLLDLTDMSNEIGISRQSLAKYVDYLEKSFMVCKLYNYSRNRMVSEKRSKKIYTRIPALSKHISLDLQKESKVMENVIALSTRAKYFWRTAQGDEVDIVLEGKAPFPIEVKQRNKKEQYGGLMKFMNRFDVRRGLVISKDIESTDRLDNKTIVHVPAWKFLLDQDKYLM
ncbi:MAG: ATP-binding protein [Nanoarchaeota archaeon]